MYTSIDLFSGVGGICTGLEWAGIKPLIAVEISDWTVETYKESHNADVLNLEDYLQGELENESEFFLPNKKTLLIHGDITKVSNDLIDRILNERFSVTTVDIVTGGAPCESFSLAGGRREDDERNNLFLNLERIAKHVDASMVLFENVKGLLSKKHDGQRGKMYELICDEFETPDQNGVSFNLVSRDPKEVLLKASHHGVPQNRERIFLVGINSKYKGSFSYPPETHGEDKEYPYVTVEDALMDLPKVEIKEGEELTNFSSIIEDSFPVHRKRFLEVVNGEKFGFPEHLIHMRGKLNSHIGPGHTKKIQERISHILPGEGMKHTAERLIANGQEDVRDRCFPNKLYAARNRRLNPDKPSFTVTSHCLDEMIHPTLNRSITPREAARLQSFPDWYLFKGPYVKFHSHPDQDRYEQIGDAIPPILAYVLGVEIVKTFKDIASREEEKKEVIHNHG